MSLPTAGTRKKGLFSQQDYLAPLAIPTGEGAFDMVNVIWRKNDVYLDIGSYSIGSGILILWPMILLFISIAYMTNDSGIYLYGA